MMSIPKYVSDVLNRLEENGFSAYVVGGCVRDYLLGRPINDEIKNIIISFRRIQYDKRQNRKELNNL